MCYGFSKRRGLKNIAHQKLNLPTHAPVMVLPNATLFPHSLLPLHIFEPRYRAMLAWCLERHRMFCVALMKPAITEARSSADFHDIAGLGLVRACRESRDGTSNLILQGLARVRLVGFLQEEPFRIAELREMQSGQTDPAEADLLRNKLLGVCAEATRHGLEMPQALEEHLAKVSDSDVLADIVAHTFLRDPSHRQEVLEQAGTADRLRVLIRHLRRELSNNDF